VTEPDRLGLADNRKKGGADGELEGVCVCMRSRMVVQKILL